jgi:hypothetical protein
MIPKRPGWYWFLPDERCPTPTGFLRTDTPVVVLVGADKYTRDGPPARMVVRFPQATFYVEDMTGDWESCVEPPFMSMKARERWKAKHVAADYQRDHEDNWRGD